MATSNAVKLYQSRANIRDLKAEKAQLKKDLNATKREFRKEVGTLAVAATVGGGVGAYAGYELQAKINEKYEAGNMLRNVTDDIPTLAVGGFALSALSIWFIKDPTIKVAAGAAGAGLAAGSLIQGTGIA